MIEEGQITQWPGCKPNARQKATGIIVSALVANKVCEYIFRRPLSLSRAYKQDQPEVLTMDWRIALNTDCILDDFCKELLESKKIEPNLTVY
jgi:hypothetical protein